jgi:hypothetical protein
MSIGVRITVRAQICPPFLVTGCTTTPKKFPENAKIYYSENGSK